MKKTLSLLITVGLIAVFAAGCSHSSSEKNDKTGKLSIYTSIYPLEYLAEEIGKDHVDAKSIYPPGVDAHTYEPTSREMTKMARSDLFIYMGSGMEGFAESAASSLKNQKTALLEIGAKKNLLDHHDSAEEHDHEDGHDHDHGHDHGDLDPHVWLDPLKMITMAEMIENELNRLDPDHKDEYAANLDGLEKKLTDLDREFTQTLKPKTQKSILVAHAAYGYWERYGIEQIPISGLSTSDEPSQKDLAKIARLAKEKHLKYVIYEQNNTNRTAELIEEHIGAEPLHIHNLEVLTEQDTKHHDDYLSIMKKNLDVLDQATNR